MNSQVAQWEKHRRNPHHFDQLVPIPPPAPLDHRCSLDNPEDEDCYSGYNQGNSWWPLRIHLVAMYAPTMRAPPWYDQALCIVAPDFEYQKLWKQIMSSEKNNLPGKAKRLELGPRKKHPVLKTIKGGRWWIAYNPRQGCEIFRIVSLMWLRGNMRGHAYPSAVIPASNASGG